MTRQARRFVDSRLGRRIRHALEPSKWWVIIFAIGGIAVIVWTLTIYRSQEAQTARQAIASTNQRSDEAKHEAEIFANANSQYHQCIASIPILTRINGFIEGDRIIRNTLVANAQANVDASTPGSKQHATRVGNLHRLQRARAKAYEVRFPVPTRRSCLVSKKKLLKSG